MPFSDPMAEGKAIQASSARALAQGMTMDKVFQLTHQLRADYNRVPIILMGYANPVLSYGVARFVSAAKAAGADGAIIVDLPPEEDHDLRRVAEKNNFAIIRLIAPTSGARLPFLLETARAFLYYVSITGTTGAERPDFDNVRVNIEKLRAQTALPIALGFGIKTPEDSKRAAQIADMVVIGSAFVEKIGAGQDITDFAKAHRAAIHSVKKS